MQSIYNFLDPIAFSIGPVAIRWYSIGYILGFALGFWFMRKTAKRWKIDVSTEDLLVFLISIAVGVIAGARLGYVLFYGNGYYFGHPLEIFLLNQGGMSFHGGLIGAAIGGVIASKLIKVPFLALADLAFVAAPIGIFFVRIANFINGELWGAPTDLPWGVVFESGGDVARHPTQLYEALLEGALIFVILFLLSRKTPARPQGFFAGMFLTLYGIFRIIVEFVRVPDAQIGYLFGDWFTMGMLLSLPVLLAGVALLLYSRVKRKSKPKTLDK